MTVVLDVGANAGQYGRELRTLGYRGRIVSFEPQPGPFAALEAASTADPAWTAVLLALGAEAGTAQMNVSALDVSSSTLRAHEASATAYAAGSPRRRP